MLSKVFPVLAIGLTAISFRNNESKLTSHKPCVCGYLGDKPHNHLYASAHNARHQTKISDILLNRITFYPAIHAYQNGWLTEPSINNVENSAKNAIRFKGKLL